MRACRSVGIPLDNGLVVGVEPERFEEMVGVALDELLKETRAADEHVAVTDKHGRVPRGLLGL